MCVMTPAVGGMMAQSFQLKDGSGLQCQPFLLLLYLL